MKKRILATILTVSMMAMFAACGSTSTGGTTGTDSVAETPGTTAAGIASAARVQSRGCKGRSPLHKIT